MPDISSISTQQKTRKKELMNSIVEKMYLVFKEYEPILGKKKFENRVKKAGKLLSSKISKTLSKTDSKGKLKNKSRRKKEKQSVSSIDK